MSGDGELPLVLVVDDDPKILAMLVTRLSRRGYRVIEAKDGNESLAQAREHRPDVVLLDVMMPDKSGWEVLKELRGDEQLRGMVVVIMTALGERYSQMTAMVYGADACVDKPFDFDELDKEIKRLLEARAPKADPPPGQ